MRDAAIGGVGGEMLGRHEGRGHRNYDTAATGVPVGTTGAGLGTTGAGIGASGAGLGATGAGAGVGVGANPSKTHGKVKEVEGKIERGVGDVAGSASLQYVHSFLSYRSLLTIRSLLRMKGENKIISGQREQAAAAGHRQADVLEAQAATHRNNAGLLHPSGGRGI